MYIKKEIVTVQGGIGTVAENLVPVREIGGP